MNRDTNPYAPPSVAETQSASTRYWHVDGINLMVKHGAILPKVDLETGVSEGAMKCVQRVGQTLLVSSFLRAMVPIALYLALSRYFHLEPGILIAAIFVVVFLSRIVSRPGGSSSGAWVWAFSEEARVKRSRMRRWIRIGLLLLLAAILILSSSAAFPYFADYGIWFMYILLGGLAVVAVLAAWSLVDRPKFRIRAASPGWMSISPVHPDAIAFLRSRQEERDRQENARPPGRKRLVRTVYLHRFPFRALMGRNLYHPLLFIRIGLMKLFRSKRLEREAWHYSEARKIPLEDLCPELRTAIGEWRGAHPEWSFVTAEHLPSPAGDLIVESAALAPPGLEHCMHFSRAWLEQMPGKGHTHVSIKTWVSDGSLIITQNMPVLPLNHPRLQFHESSGPPDRLFETHLLHLAGHAIEPSPDLQGLLDRLKAESELTDRLLTEAGLQSEPREVD